jgi:hypothetical protein
VDLPQFSSHDSAVRATAFGLVNMTIDRASLELAARKALAPDAAADAIEGNHDLRLKAWIAKYAHQLVGIRRARLNPSDAYEDPSLSLKYLLRMDEIGWNSSGRSYPNDVLWLNHNTRVIHGEIASITPGTTLTKLLSQEVNTIQGHTPHGGTAYRTVPRGGDGATRTYVAHIVPGFMRTDNMVPAASSKGDDYGVPSEADGKPWEQGFSIVYYDEDGSAVPQIEYVPIFGGRAFWRGKEYKARCDVDGNPLAML